MSNTIWYMFAKAENFILSFLCAWVKNCLTFVPASSTKLMEKFGAYKIRAFSFLWYLGDETSVKMTCQVQSFSCWKFLTSSTNVAVIWVEKSLSMSYNKWPVITTLKSEDCTNDIFDSCLYQLSLSCKLETDWRHYSEEHWRYYKNLTKNSLTGAILQENVQLRLLDWSKSSRGLGAQQLPKLVPNGCIIPW